MTPEEELEYLYGVRSYISNRIERLRAQIKNKKRRKEPKLGELSYSGLFVQSDCLIPYLRRAFDSGETVSSLAVRANVSDGTIYNIWNEKSLWTREEIAEKILLALDLPHVFTDIAKVRIRRNYNKAPEPPISHYEEV